MATHSCILAWRIPWTGEPGRSMGLQRVRHDWATITHTHTHTHTSQLLYPPVIGHLGCFNAPTIINSAAVEHWHTCVFFNYENWGGDWTYFSSLQLSPLLWDWRKLTQQVQGDHCHLSCSQSSGSLRRAWAQEWLQGSSRWLALSPWTEGAQVPGAVRKS